MPIWKPFMAWMAVWALDGLSKLTKPEEEKIEWKKQIQTSVRRQRQQKANQCKITCMGENVSFITKHTVTVIITDTTMSVATTATHRSICSDWWRGQQTPSRRWRFQRAGTSAVSRSRWTPVAGGRWRCYSPRVLYAKTGARQGHGKDMTWQDKTKQDRAG